MVHKANSVSFSIPEMYNLVRGSSSAWGLEGYRVPTLHVDAAKKKFNDDMYEINIGKKKRPAQTRLDPKEVAKITKNGIFEQIER